VYNNNDHHQTAVAAASEYGVGAIYRHHTVYNALYIFIYYGCHA